jgi:site-specific recombinase XerD
VAGWQVDLEQQVQNGNLTDTMRKTYEWGFAQFLDWLDHTQVEAVTGPVIEEWVSGLHNQGHNSFSISFWLSCVQNFFHWAYASGGVSSDPTNGVESGLDGLRANQA